MLHCRFLQPGLRAVTYEGPGHVAQGHTARSVQPQPRVPRAALRCSPMHDVDSFVKREASVASILHTCTLCRSLHLPLVSCLAARHSLWLDDLSMFSTTPLSC